MASKYGIGSRVGFSYHNGPPLAWDAPPRRPITGEGTLIGATVVRVGMAPARRYEVWLAIVDDRGNFHAVPEMGVTFLTPPEPDHAAAH